jgi:hypothetical protein
VDQQFAAMTLDIATELVHCVPPFHRRRRIGVDPSLVIPERGRCSHLFDLRPEIEQVGQPATLDLDEVDVVDSDGIRLLNECQTQGIQVVNCSPYIREWMLQEKRTGDDEE